MKFMHNHMKKSTPSRICLPGIEAVCVGLIAFAVIFEICFAATLVKILKLKLRKHMGLYCYIWIAFYFWQQNNCPVIKMRGRATTLLPPPAADHHSSTASYGPRWLLTMKKMGILSSPWDRQLTYTHRRRPQGLVSPDRLGWRKGWKSARIIGWRLWIWIHRRSR
jgi:hypothetical protein